MAGINAVGDSPGLITTTLAKYASKTLADNIFSSMPLLYWLRQGGRVAPLDGGERIREPLN